jgi:photosystem I P700 chlorophyll a apoprotein A1
LNGDVGGGFKVFKLLLVLSIMARKWYYKRTSTLLNCDWRFSNGSSYVFCWLVPLPQSAPKLEWFQNVESMLNHHLAGLLGLGSLAWAGHQIHVSLPINKLLDV